ncbi:ATP-binding protein [Candidatus Bathyarchaeota archaeon]|nr:ATP-binding protein [Candidatus Bathyarchaeota archaeon]
MDPRTAIIDERLKNVRNVIAVSSGKGGVGKTLVASVLALILARNGYKVGFFDLDFTSPSSHVVLNIGNEQPKEEKGIVPPQIHGLRFMSVVYYSAGRASSLRGSETSDAFIELLAVTKWGNLDYLILDMPPGIGDVTLDLLRFVQNVKFLIVTTPSRLAFETVGKLLDLLRETKNPVVGVIENMQTQESTWIRSQVEAKGFSYLGALPFDSELEQNIGNIDGLLNTQFGKNLKKIIENLFLKNAFLEKRKVGC